MGLAGEPGVQVVVIDDCEDRGPWSDHFERAVVVAQAPPESRAPIIDGARRNEHEIDRGGRSRFEPGSVGLRDPVQPVHAIAGVDGPREPVAWQ